MKVVLTTTDGEELTISEENAKKDEFNGYAEGQVLAVLQFGELPIRVDAEELVRAVDAMWSENTETW